MRRGTTPTITVNVDGIDFEDVSHWYISIKQGSYVLTKTEDDIELKEDEHVAEVPLSQEETLNLRSGMAEIQIRLSLKDGSKVASDIKELLVDSILYDEEIE